MSTVTNAAPAPSRFRRTYRVDLDGLRGFAIMLVVLFHVFIGRVSSGVDVFLFIGGIFFFGPQLRNAFSATGMTIPQGLWRLLRRLFPALITVIFISSALALWLMSRARWPDIIDDSLASTFYVQNLRLISQGQDYAAIGTDVSVFQHLWSMSVQFQIYVAVLILIGVIGAVKLAAQRHGKNWEMPLQRGAYALLILLTIASFIYALVLSDIDQGVNYYSPLSRFWEIALGGLFGIWVIRRTVPAAMERWRGMVRTLGLLVIVSIGFLIDGSQTFPGPWTLVPIAAAALVVWSGNPSAADTDRPVPSILESPVFQYLGRISYSLYLWHWPLLVLAPWVIQPQGEAATDGELGIFAVYPVGTGLAVGIGVIVLSMVLATLTHKYIETPLRQPRKPARAWWPRGDEVVASVRAARPITTIGSVWVAVATVAVLLMSVVPQAVSRPATDEDEALGSGEYVGPNALIENTMVPPRAPIPDAMLPVEDMYPLPHDGCTGLFEHEEPILYHNRNESDIPCYYGDLDSDREMYVIGSSRAEHFLPAIIELGLEHGFKVRPLIKMGCFFGAGPYDTTGEDYPECGVWQDNVRHYVSENPPSEGVVMLVTRTNNDPTGPVEEVPESVVDYAREFTEQGITVYGVRDTPMPHDENGPINARLCVADGNYAPDNPMMDCGMSREMALAEDNPAHEALADVPVHHIDLTPAFCGPERCPGVIGNVLVYRDSTHVTNTYARLLAPVMERQMFPEEAGQPDYAGMVDQPEAQRLES